MDISAIEINLDNSPDNQQLLRQWLQVQSSESVAMSRRKPAWYAKEGLRLHRAGQLPAALWHYRVCLAVSPGRGDVWANLEQTNGVRPPSWQVWPLNEPPLRLTARALWCRPVGACCLTLPCLFAIVWAEVGYANDQYVLRNTYKDVFQRY